MNNIVKSIKQELLKRCNIYKEKYGYDFWDDHIKYVVKRRWYKICKRYVEKMILSLWKLRFCMIMRVQKGFIKNTI